MSNPTTNDLSKVIIASESRKISAIFFGDPSDWSESGEFFINVGNGAYEIPTDFFVHPQSWQDVLEVGDPDYPTDNEDWFSHSFTEENEIWNVFYFYKNDKGDNGYRDVIRLRFKYLGNSDKNLFELLYKIYNIKVFIFDNDDSELSGTYCVRSFENDGSANTEHLIEQELELEPLLLSN